MSKILVIAEVTEMEPYSQRHKNFCFIKAYMVGGPIFLKFSHWLSFTCWEAICTKAGRPIIMRPAALCPERTTAG